MRTLVASIVFFIAAGAISYGQSLPEIIAGMRSHFAGITSLHSEVMTEKKPEPAYRKIDPEIDLSTPTKFTFSCWEKTHSTMSSTGKRPEKRASWRGRLAQEASINT